MTDATKAADTKAEAKAEEKEKQQRAPWGHAIGKDSGRISQAVWEMQAGTIADLVKKCPKLDSKQNKASRIKSHLQHLAKERNAILLTASTFAVIGLNNENDAKSRERASGKNVEFSDSAQKKAASKLNSLEAKKEE